MGYSVSWKRLGQVFSPKHGEGWIPQAIGGTHIKNGAANRTQVPTVLVFPDRFRIYFSTRDKTGKSYPLFVDVDKSNPTKILYAHQTSILEPSNPGCFDEDGIMPGYALHHQGKVWMYYSGWNAKISTPYHNATGLAESHDGTNFTRVFEGPVMDRTHTEPHLAVTPTILIEDGVWKNWYISGIKWVLQDNYYEPVYGIKYAESLDGIHWKRFPELCIPQAHENEAFSHPSVLRSEDGLYEMWYCFRDSFNYRAAGGGAYRIGYAYSNDGKNWTRADNIKGMTVGNEDWENEMVCYPFVVRNNERILMFYNGNNFGAGGIGVAEWVDS